MDRNSHAKLKPVFLISLAFLVFCGVVLYEKVQEQFFREEQELLSLYCKAPETTGELIAVLQGKDTMSAKDSHPLSDPPGKSGQGSSQGGENEGSSAEKNRSFQEKEISLREKYQYGPMDFKSCRSITAGGISIMAAGQLSIFAVYLFLEKRRRSYDRDKEQQMIKIEEQLKEMSRGSYDYHMQESCLSEYGQIEQLIRETRLRFCQLTEKAQREEQETKELITNISHQLKTPLASIKLSLEMMEYDKLTEEERKSFFLKGKAEVEKLDELFRTLLNLSRLEKHIIQVKPQCAHIKDCILNAVDSVYMKARKKGIELSLETDEKFLCCYDKKWTTEAFVNILDNAVKYSHRDTKIQIRVLPLPHYCLVEIEDEGIGIKREEYHKIFQRFYRGMQASEMEEEGAGVGLYLARMIIERQKGLIKIKSKAGAGTIVQIMLPREVR